MPRTSTTSARLKTATRAAVTAALSATAGRASKQVRGARTGGGAADRSMTSKSVAGHITLEGITQFSSSSKSETITGADYLAAITIPTTVTAGSVVSNILVTPTGLAARLSAIAALWERYQFEYLELVYNPSVPTTTQGQIILTYDPDSVDVTPTGDARAFALATDDNIAGPIYAPFSLVVRNLDKNTLYYTRDANSEDRFEIQGQFYVVYSGTAPSAALECGTLSLRYRVKFTKRCYEIAAPTAIPPTDSFTSWIQSPLQCPTTDRVLGALYDTFGQTNVDKVILSTKGVMLKRGMNYVRTILSGYPKGSSVAAVNTLLDAVLTRLSDDKETPAYIGQSIGTVFGTTVASTTDYSVISESAVSQTGITTGATNHMISYFAINVDTPGTYYLDMRLTTSACSYHYVTGYSIAMIDRPSYLRDVYAGYETKTSVAVWTSPATAGYEMPDALAVSTSRPATSAAATPLIRRV